VEHNPVQGFDVEVFAMAARVSKRGVGFANEVGSQLAADWVQEAWSDEPACYGCQDWWQEEKDQQDSDDSTADGHGHN
jgi:hypothetical protein